MKTIDYIIIPFEGIDYKINVEKLEYTLSYLENKKVKIKDNKDIDKYFKKYKLYDKDFLENVNKI